MARYSTTLLMFSAVAMVAIGSPARAQSAQASAGAAARAIPMPRGFSLSLVQGDMKNQGASDAVPPPVAKALADLKDFLPYKSYALLDTAWTATAYGTAKAQLRRADGVVYNVGMTINQSPQGGVYVSHFQVRTASAAASSGQEQADAEAQARALQQEVNALRQRVAELQAQHQTAEAQQLSARLADLQREYEVMKAASTQLEAKDAIIDTSFQMKLGETVVVGTSRLQGDKALIVLVTAVGQ